MNIFNIDCLHVENEQWLKDISSFETSIGYCFDNDHHFYQAYAHLKEIKSVVVKSNA